MFSSFLLNVADLGRGLISLGLDFGVHELLMFCGDAYVVAGVVAGVVLVLWLRRRRGGGDGGSVTESRRRV